MSSAARDAEGEALAAASAVPLGRGLDVEAGVGGGGVTTRWVGDAVADVLVVGPSACGHPASA
jgi:hypothetical protein